jgi:MipA family protein
MKPILSARFAVLVNAFGATLLFGVAPNVLAQSDFYRKLTPPNVAQGGVAGAVVLTGREYQGSNESRTRLLPSVDYQWANGLFAGVINGFGYNASTRPDLAYGVRITANFGRDERRSTALRGLGDIDTRPEFGAFLNYSPVRSISLISSLRFGSGNSRDGALLDLGASWGTVLSQDLQFGTSLATTWSNAAYAQEYFGIDATQALRSGYGLYQPKSGLRDARLSAGLRYRFTPAWALTASLTHTELLGDSKNSPIVRERSTTSALFTIGYSF